MDLAAHYRSLVRKHFPSPDRGRSLPLIRLIHHHFLACWREIDPGGSRNRGLLSLMRRHRHDLKPDQQTKLAAYLTGHPALRELYRFKQKLCYLLKKKHKTRKQCERLVPRFLRAIYELKNVGFAALVQLGHTLENWATEIVAMRRFTKNNGITEGLPQQDGNHQPSGIRLPQLRKPPMPSESFMWLN
jgi:transposase